MIGHLGAVGSSFSQHADAAYGINVPDRLTLQREANDLLDQLARAHAIMDQFSPSPSTSNNASALLPLGQAISASREQMQRLVERLDGLLGMIGQI